MKKIITITLFMALIFHQLVFGQNQSIESLEEAASLNQKVIDLYNVGEYEKAIPYAKKNVGDR